MAIKLRATRPPAQAVLDDSPCPPGHNTPFSLERAAPVSFKRLLGAALVNKNPDIRAPVPHDPPTLPPRARYVQKIWTEADVPMPIPPPLNAPSSTGELDRSAPERRACADDVHRTVNAVGDGDPATETAGFLDLHSDVKKAVAVKVAELIHRIQRR